MVRGGLRGRGGSGGRDEALGTRRARDPSRREPPRLLRLGAVFRQRPHPQPNDARPVPNGGYGGPVLPLWGQRLYRAVVVRRRRHCARAHAAAVPISPGRHGRAHYFRDANAFPRDAVLQPVRAERHLDGGMGPGNRNRDVEVSRRGYRQAVRRDGGRAARQRRGRRLSRKDRKDPLLVHYGSPIGVRVRLEGKRVHDYGDDGTVPRPGAREPKLACGAVDGIRRGRLAARSRRQDRSWVVGHPITRLGDAGHLQGSGVPRAPRYPHAPVVGRVRQHLPGYPTAGLDWTDACGSGWGGGTDRSSAARRHRRRIPRDRAADLRGVGVRPQVE